MPAPTIEPQLLPKILNEIQKYPEVTPAESPVKRTTEKQASTRSTDKIAVGFKNGNLTQETSEVIVNTVGDSIGPLFHNILEVGGP